MNSKKGARLAQKKTKTKKKPNMKLPSTTFHLVSACARHASKEQVDMVMEKVIHVLHKKASVDDVRAVVKEFGGDVYEKVMRDVSHPRGRKLSYVLFCRLVNILSSMYFDLHQLAEVGVGLAQLDCGDVSLHRFLSTVPSQKARQDIAKELIHYDRAVTLASLS